MCNWGLFHGAQELALKIEEVMSRLVNTCVEKAVPLMTSMLPMVVHSRMKIDEKRRLLAQAESVPCGRLIRR